MSDSPVGEGLSLRGLFRAVLLVSVAVRSVFAQTPAPTVRTMEFETAVKQAVERNPSVATAETAFAEADALLQQARATLRPNASAAITNTTLDASRGFAGGTTQPQNQFAFTATVTAPLLAPIDRALADQAGDRVEVAKLSSLDTRRQIAVATARAYLSVLTARRQIGVDMQALEAARAHLDYADKRLEGGAGSRLNQLRAAQAVAEDEMRLENARLALRRAQEALGVLVVEDGPVDAAADPAFDLPPTEQDAATLESRPDLQREAATIRAAERVVRDTKRAWLPTGDVSFTPLFVAPSGLFQPSSSFRLVFSLSQTLFDARVRPAKAVHQIAVSRAQYARAALEIQAKSEVRTARASVESLERVRDSARLAAERAAEVLRVTTSAFQLGATTNLEVIDAQRSARDADSNVTIAEDAVRRARLDVLVALGRFP